MHGDMPTLGKAAPKPGTKAAARLERANNMARCIEARIELMQTYEFVKINGCATVERLVQLSCPSGSK
jgi:hypothetical protein